jgi:hypothetical protein
MLVEYLLLLVATLGLMLKVASVPKKAFTESAPRLAARVERNISTGYGFKDKTGQPLNWSSGN